MGEVGLSAIGEHCEEDDQNENSECLHQTTCCFQNHGYEDHGNLTEHNNALPEVSRSLEAIVEEAELKTNALVLKTCLIAS